MFPQAEGFDRGLRRRSPHTATPVHYLNDLKLFFARVACTAGSLIVCAGVSTEL
jgi:hypothetical protein